MAKLAKCRSNVSICYISNLLAKVLILRMEYVEYWESREAMLP